MAREGRSKRSISSHLAFREERIPYPEGIERPKTRGDCANVSRPCPFAGCKYHLFLDVTATGSLTLNFPDLEPGDLKESCSLDIADQGPATFSEIGDALNICREAVRKLEIRAIEENRSLFRHLKVVYFELDED